MQCIFILSDKSSGSSILQRELTNHPAIRMVKHTRHGQNETLYWNKAAACLGLEQAVISYSEIPFRAEVAKRDLRKFLFENLGSLPNEVVPLDFVMEGWYRLCLLNQPVLLEKSPQHLHSLHALELMERFQERYQDVDVHYIGLVRNPMDTLYSMWKRWGARPERTAPEWIRAYSNLQEFSKRVGDRMSIIHYEDMVTDPSVLTETLTRFDLPASGKVGTQLHTRSVSKWKSDPRYGFQPDESLRNLAGRYDYSDEELHNTPQLLWPLRSRLNGLKYFRKKALSRVRKRFRKNMHARDNG